MKNYLIIFLLIGIAFPASGQENNKKWFLSFTASPALMHRSTIGVEPSFQVHEGLWNEIEKAKIGFSGGVEIGRHIGNWDILGGFRFTDRGYKIVTDSLVFPDRVTATGFVRLEEPFSSYTQVYCSYMLDMPITIRRRLGNGKITGYVAAAVVPSWSVKNSRKYTLRENGEVIIQGSDKIGHGIPHQFNLSAEVQGGVLIALSENLRLKTALAAGSQFFEWIEDDHFNRRLWEARLDIGLEYTFR